VNQVVQGAPEDLGPNKWLTGTRFDPPTWCGVARALCAGDVETLPKWRSSLVEAVSR
jgi:hypothetical protein